MLAAKAALAIRVDALGEDVNSEHGYEHRAKLESRMKQLEEGFVSAVLLYFSLIIQSCIILGLKFQ